MFFNRFLTYLFLIPVMLGFSSCIYDFGKDLPDVPDESKEVTLALSVSVLENINPDSQSRAFPITDDKTTEPPVTDYEKLRTLRVVIVRPDGTIEHNRYVVFNQATGIINHDNLKFTVVSGEEKMIYLFGNEALVSETNGFDFSDLAVGTTFPVDRVNELVLKMNNDNVVINNNVPSFQCTYIPMSESFKYYVPEPQNNGDFYREANLFITRSLIKFSFSLNNTEALPKNVKIKGIKISKLADKSFYMPNNVTYNPPKYPLSGSKDGRLIEDGFNTPETSPVDVVFPIMPSCELTTPNSSYEYSPQWYFPESKVTGKYILTLLFDDDSSWTEGTEDNVTTILSLTETYGTKELDITDIPRNTHVKINIIIKGKDYDATVDLVPYRGCTLDPDFGMEDDYYKPAITEIWVTPQVEVFSGTWDSNAPDWSNPNSIKATPNTRFATVSGGKMYTIDQKTMSIAEITPEGTLKPKYYLPNPANLGPLGTPTDYYGTAIAADEEGNFLIGMNFTQRPTSSTKFAIYSPATGVCKLFSLKPPEDWIVGRLDCIGHVLGDLTRDAVFTIVPESDYADNGTVIETTSKVRIIKVSGDGTLGSVTMTDIRHVPVGGNNTPQNIAVPAYHTMAEAKAANAVYDFYYSSCNGFANYYAYYNGSEVKSNFAPRMLTTTVAGNNGFDTFVVDGKRYFVRNSATIIQQRTMNIVVMDDRGRGLARWENPDYVVNSGYSTIVAVPLEDNTVDIYVFNSGTNSGAAAKLNFNPLQVH